MGSPQPLHDRAIENLRFIRDTMARAGAFTAVPGKGQVALGLTALGAAFLAHRAPSRLAWLETWLGEAVVALAIGAVSMARKARAADDSLLSGPGRRVVLSFFPALLAGGLLTAALFVAGSTDPLPGLWLLLYGTGVAAAGAFSVRVVPLMGVAFLACGGAALFTPPAWGDTWMAVGFGGLHIAFGAIIARRYGG